MVSRENSYGAFCEDLLVDILCRLSGRDLLKCKCVSKEWHRIISQVCAPLLSAKAPVSGVYFRVIRADDLPEASVISPPEAVDRLYNLVAHSDSIHYIGSANLLPRPHLCKGYPSAKLALTEFAGMSFANMLPFKHRGPDFLDCCNGLMLLVQRPKPQFFVCNPAISQCVPVPLPPPSIHLSSLYASLAFDPSESIHYRVVISSLSTQRPYMHIFCSQTGEWMTHEVQIEVPKCFQLVRHSVYMRNVVYRLSMSSEIVCFDLKSPKAYIINGPPQNFIPNNSENNTKCKPPPGCIALSNGSLCYVRHEELTISVWMLEKSNGYTSEWSLKYKISALKLLSKGAKLRRHQPINDLWFRPCAFHPTSDILFLSSGASTLKYHIESGHLREVGFLFEWEKHCGIFFPMFLHKNTYVTLKNWCRGTASDIDKYEDVQDEWSYIEQ